MDIRKLIWILGVIFLVVALTFGISALKKQYTIQQIKQLPTQEEKTQQEEPTEAAMNEEDDVEAKEDPVKDFLSEKAQKAMKHFFTKELNIVAIGDSLTEGIGDEINNQGYVGILSDTINQEKDLVETWNFGKKGNRSDQLIARLEEPEIVDAMEDADIILITIGANDIMKIFKENFTDLTLDKFSTGKINYEKRLDYIFTFIEELNPRADVYLVGFYNPFKRYFADIEELEIIIDDWNTISEEVAEEHKRAHYIPTKDLFENTSINYLSEDNFHPNHLGYELMAERVLHYITNEGEADDREE